jgi:type IV secretory pathway VirB10-like protein
MRLLRLLLHANEKRLREALIMAPLDNSGAPLTPEPPRLTRIRRNLAKTLLIALCSALLAIVLVHALSHPHETAAERRQREQIEADARQPKASPDALRKRLEDQRNLALARAGSDATAASAPLGGTPLDGIPRGIPGEDSGPLPSGYHVPGRDSTSSDADRLALQRQIEAMQSQSLVAYEDTGGDAGSASGQGSNGLSLDTLADGLSRLSPQRASTSASDAAGDRGATTSGFSALSAASATARRNVDWLAQQRQEGDDEEKPLVSTPISSPYMVMGGTPIPTVLLQGAKSDLPGSTTASTVRASSSRRAPASSGEPATMWRSART